MLSSLSKYPIVAVYVLWWLFWMTAQAIVVHRFGWSWELSVADAVVSNGLLALASGVTENIYRFYQPGSSNRLYRFVVGVVLAWLSITGLQYALLQLYPQEFAFHLFLEKSIPVRFMFSLLMIAFVTVTSWLYFYIENEKEISLRKEDAEKLLREAELNNLRQQLQPHFLFNSLNSISALAGTKPDQARKMIQQLSDFLRGTLHKDEQQLVAFSEELAHLLLYLDIEKVRFGHRLSIQINCDPNTQSAFLPSLLLQPILENAIKFGLYDTLGETTISLNATMKDDTLCVSIQNPFDTETAGTKHGTGFGLKAVQRRLYLLYGRNDLLRAKQQDGLYRATLVIPQP